MRRHIISLLNYSPLCLLVFFSGCSFNIDVDYQIRNESGESITIFVEGPFIDADTSMISDGTSLIFFDQTEGARSATEYLDNLDAIGFKIFIANETGQLYNKDPMDISNWQKIYPETKNGLGKVELTVRPADFD